jgi:hypothetical protein
VGHFYPPEDVTYGEWAYLVSRYGDDEAEERRERIALTLRRLHRRRISSRRVHTALLLGIKLWYEHGRHLEARTGARKRQAAVARAQRDVDRALRSLRALLPPGWPFNTSDTDLFLMRHVLLGPIEVPPAERERGGRPSQWNVEADAALRNIGVPDRDRRELLTAIGFVQDK